jgi:outer membrane protein assembly factor BamB
MRLSLALSAISIVAMLGGCGPTLEKSPDAAPLPATVSPTSASDVNWPAWRGVNAAGVGDGFALADRLETAQRWKSSIGGTGNSSPVVWGGHIYLTSQIGDRMRLSLQCFDRNDGKLVWQTEVADASGQTHAKNGHASASVATNGERIFAFFGSAGLYAFDMQGKQLWRRDLGELEHRWGTASSPVLFGDSVIQLCDRNEDSYLASFRQSDGEPVWQTKRDSSGCWTTPVLFDPEGHDPQLIVNGTGGERGGSGHVIAYDPQNGRELWRVRGTTHVVCPTAILGAGLIVSTSGRNGPIMAIRPSAAGEPTVVWKTRRGGPYVPTGVAYRNRLYLINDGGVLACYNLGDGEQLWEHRLRGPVTASLVAGDGKLYVVSEQGEVSVVAAEDAFRLLGEYSLDEHTLATPALSGGQIFIRTDGHLFAFGKPSADDDALRAAMYAPLKQ